MKLSTEAKNQRADFKALLGEVQLGEQDLRYSQLGLLAACALQYITELEYKNRVLEAEIKKLKQRAVRKKRKKA